MSTTHEGGRPLLEEPEAPPRTNGAATGLLRLPESHASEALARRLPREWILPGADELFRRIYTRSSGGRADVLAVCSAIGGEGKTTVSLGLGVTIAEDFPDRRVLIVETDLEKPVLAKDFQVDLTPGLADCLLNSEPVEMAFRPTYLENLQLVPAGNPSRSSGRLLRSSGMAMAIDVMRTTHDVVILDVPALLTNSDAMLLTDLADGVLMVVRAGVTPVTQVNKAVEELDEGRLRGVVLNGYAPATPGWLRRLLGW